MSDKQMRCVLLFLGTFIFVFAAFESLSTTLGGASGAAAIFVALR